MCGGPCCVIGCLTFPPLTAMLPAVGVLCFALLQYWSLHDERQKAAGCDPSLCSHPCLTVDPPANASGVPNYCTGCPVTEAAMSVGRFVIYAALPVFAVDLALFASHMLTWHSCGAGRDVDAPAADPAATASVADVDAPPKDPRRKFLHVGVPILRVAVYIVFAGVVGSKCSTSGNKFCVPCRDSECGVAGPLPLEVRYIAFVVLFALIALAHNIALFCAAWHNERIPFAGATEPEPPAAPVNTTVVPAQYAAQKGSI